MFTRILVFYILHLAQIRVKCNNIYVHPKTVYATGGRAGGTIAVDCMIAYDDRVDIANRGVSRTRIHVEWIKLNTLSVISSHPESRVRRDGHRLLFDSTSYSDEGFYCCRPTAKSHILERIIGCTYNSTVRVVMAKAAKNVQMTDHHGHNVVAKSISGTNTWTLEALPRTRCVILGQRASINCLNNTNSFAENIQWFKILGNGGLQLIPHTSGARISSNAHQLQFTSTVAEDAGLYCCKTVNEIECSPTAIANVTISLPPILFPLQNQTVVLGETIFISCTANTSTGESVSLSWQKNGKELPADESIYSTISSMNNTTLKITNATKLDQGYFSCIAKNRKYQHASQSMYLHVQNPLGCNEISISHSITIGLRTSVKNCNLIEKALLYNVINKFLQSICNCSDYCLTIDDINCSLDDITITIVMTLKEKQPLYLKNLIYSTLQEREVKVDQNSIFCVVNTLCEKQTTQPPTTETIIIPTIISTPTSEVTEESNATNPAITIGLTAVTILVFLILTLLVITTIVLRLKRRKQKKKQISRVIVNVTNPHQSANENMASNKHPSTLSDESGYYEGHDKSPSHKIQWEHNEIYQRIIPPNPALTVPVPDCRPPATKEVNPKNNYDDILDINETRRAGASHAHLGSSSPDIITQHPQFACNNHNVPFHGVNTSRNVTKSLNNINHDLLPSSQV